jgi:hypothetical protein
MQTKSQRSEYYAENLFNKFPEFVSNLMLH